LGFYGEATPFLNTSTNVLAHVAQYANLLTFGAALAIEVEMNEGINPFLFGSVLVVINALVVGLVLRATVSRQMRERSRAQWRRLSDEELGVVNSILPPANGLGAQDEPSSKGVEMVERLEAEDGGMESRTEQALKQTLIDSKHVKMTQRVGAGAFGEVGASPLVC
jgi:hypothetical protein